MTAAPATWAGWRDRLRRHERALAAAWLAGTAALLGALLVPAARRSLLDGLQAAVLHWDERWTRRLAEAERLLRTGPPARAEAYLAALDRSFPARNVRHARDKQRERLLLLLARSEETLGRRRRALATYGRLVRFDSLNYLNYYEQGRAIERMTGHWAVEPEARDAFAAALRLMPSHLPSLRGYLGFYLDRSEFHPVVEAYQRYLDAFLMQHVEISLGDTTVMIPVQVDGLSHLVVAELPRPAGWAGDLVINTRGFSVAIDSAVIVPGLVVGAGVRADPEVLSLAHPVLQGLEPGEHRAWRARGAASLVRLAVPPVAQGAIQVRLALRLFKPIERDLWSRISNSYRNLLDPDGLATAAARTVTFPTEQDADRALARLPWARQGRLLAPDEYPF